MNLEDLEQKVLSYLKQVANPLVRIEVLLARLRRDEGFADMSEAKLMDFLKHHELFKVIDQGGMVSDGEVAQAFELAGFVSGPCVILDTRLPTPGQVAELMTEQLGKMKEALTVALDQAREKGDTASTDKLLEALARADRIHKGLGALGTPG